MTMPWRFVCEECGKVGHGRMKGWYEAMDAPPGSTDEEKVRFVNEQLRRRRSGRWFICPACAEREFGLPPSGGTS
jgi:hypothetical protein